MRLKEPQFMSLNALVAWYGANLSRRRTIPFLVMLTAKSSGKTWRICAAAFLNNAMARA